MHDERQRPDESPTTKTIPRRAVKVTKPSRREARALNPHGARRAPVSMPADARRGTIQARDQVNHVVNLAVAMEKGLREKATLLTQQADRSTDLEERLALRRQAGEVAAEADTYVDRIAEGRRLADKIRFELGKLAT